MTWYAGLHENADNRHIHIFWFKDEPSHYSRKKRRYVYHQGRINPVCLQSLKVDVQRFFSSAAAQFGATGMPVAIKEIKKKKHRKARNQEGEDGAIEVHAPARM